MEKDELTKMISSLFQIHAKIDWFIKDLFRRIVQPTHEAIKFSRKLNIEHSFMTFEIH